jgi:hypothetical protein
MSKLTIEKFLEEVQKASWQANDGRHIFVYSWDDDVYWQKYDEKDITFYGHRAITDFLCNLYGAHNVDSMYISSGHEYTVMYRIRLPKC